MSTRNDKWENGSYFHLFFSEKEGGETSDILPKTWLNNGNYFASGRDALKALAINKGKKLWKRLWIPAYFCPIVIDTLADLALEICFYEDSPVNLTFDFANLPVLDGDALFIVNYFGLRSKPDLTCCKNKSIEIIEDHSHDPLSAWAYDSEADWCLASLRKTHPLPDGGVLWSPANHKLQGTFLVTTEQMQVLAKKMTGMLIKKFYLEGASVNKKEYLEFLHQGELEIATGNISSITEISKNLFLSYPIKNWRRIRQQNFYAFANFFATEIGDVKGTRLLISDKIQTDIVPFSCAIIFPAKKQCEFVLQRLVDANIFPARLWQLNNKVFPIPNGIIDLGNRLLSIHCDMRYGAEDMEKIVGVIKKSLFEFHSVYEHRK